MNLELNIPSPISEVEIAGRKVLIKREDLIHPSLSGNKFRKLKYNLVNLENQGHQLVVSFGGAYSNHIHALAFACHYFKLRLILFIRGEEVNNPTLDHVEEFGAEIRFVTRTEYRTIKNQTYFSEWPEAYVIPEGGTNDLALKGVGEMMTEIELQDVQICVPYGSGGTSLGIMSNLKPNSNLHIFSALKFPSFEMEFLLKCRHLRIEASRYILHDEFHFGGYGKWNSELIDFINLFPIPLDPIYTGKMFYGIKDLINREKFDPDRPILAIHTGGLQGIAGFNERFGHIIRT
ncbi:1-aminocyclopropane-1-carboxylate deaminase/D-cysteine desulfhydrase [Portibacter marinus]|uniref:1-aminocyclopropane-1-carboxylate deaminase/D-cysteine desulfhydrase n=1 Tax=Portibacter marinus TaxID=2898660 RepID=UPI001F1FC049|nr:pyridoxal-phosphate dependent enzyme [Portibacter marinus]